MFAEDTGGGGAPVPESERQRRVMFLRMGMILCLILVLMDGNRTPGTAAPARRQGGDGVRGGEPNDDKPSLVAGMEFNPKVATALSNLLGSSGHLQNVTGVYKGSSAGVRTLIQLKSIPIINVSSMLYVYGIARVFAFGGKNGNYDIMFPLQGLFVSTSPDEGYLTIFSFPFVNQRLAIEVTIPHENSIPNPVQFYLNSSTNNSMRQRGVSGSNDESVAGRVSGKKHRRARSRHRQLDHPMPTIWTRADHMTERRRLQANSTMRSIDLYMGRGVKLVAYSSLADLSDIAHSRDSAEAIAFQTLRDDMLPPDFRNILYPSHAPLTASCNYIFTMKSSFLNNSLSSAANVFASSIEGSAESLTGCSPFNMTTSNLLLTADLLDRKINVYVAIAVLVSIAQIGFFIVQLRYSTSSGTLGKVSILCICSQAILDSLLCIFHLMLCGAFAKFTVHFLSIAALELILFSVFGMRCVVGIYQARYSQEFAAEGIEGLRRRLGTIHARFYICLFGVIAIFYLFTPTPPLILALFSVWMPQIVWNAVNGSRYGLSYTYLFGSAVARLVLPLYVLGCPKNMFALILDDMLYSPQTCLALVLWTCLQCAILVTQDLQGSRFFVPRQLLPERYNYYRQVPIREQTDIEGGGLPECVICYCSVDTTERGAGHMVTPCEHAFHSECLSRWMEVKLECPVCRATLPSIE